MSAEDVKFRVTDKKNGATAIISLTDLFGYEGMLEGCGICIKYDEHIPKDLQGAMISFNSGYDYNGMNKRYEIEPYKEDNPAKEVKAPPLPVKETEGTPHWLVWAAIGLWGLIMFFIVLSAVL